MAKKAELLKKAEELGVDVTPKNTIAEIEEALLNAEKSAPGIAVNDEPIAVESTATEDETGEQADATDKTYKKSGKGSKKAEAEARELEEKEARKEAGDTSPVDPDAEESVKKGPIPVTRPKIERRSKNYRKSAEKIETDKTYSLEEAVALAKETSTVKFDASVELHVNLNVDPKHAD